ncbi:MAG: hypothetical protein NTW61_08815 [Candidatus Melainabacteria bacterium]|nr:hypothetical protein [Candidatus Melainabacteria bacterium]
MMGLFYLFKKKKKAAPPPPPPPPPPSEFQYNDALGTEYRTWVDGNVQRSAVKLSQADQANVNAAKEGSGVLINELGQSNYQLQQQRDVRQNQLFQVNYNSLLDFYNTQASKTRAANAKRLGSASTNTFLGQQLLGLQQQTTQGINEAQLNAYNQAWSDQLQQQSASQDRLSSLTNVLDFYQRTVQPYAQFGNTSNSDARQLLLAQQKAIDANNANNFRLANSGSSSTFNLQKILTQVGQISTLFM